jgi:hypothetical protein
LTRNPILSYTYIYYDPSRNNEPIYVGCGIGDRVWRHLYRKNVHPFTQRLEFMEKNGVKPMIGIYAGLDKELALFLEEELITKFGRKDLGLGPLLNLTNGGEIGPTGAKHPCTDEHKRKLSNASIGKKKSEEARRNMSLAKKDQPGTTRKGMKKLKIYKVKTPDGTFESIVDAANFYKIGISAVYQRCAKRVKSSQNWEVIKEI